MWVLQGLGDADGWGPGRDRGPWEQRWVPGAAPATALGSWDGVAQGESWEVPGELPGQQCSQTLRTS